MKFVALREKSSQSDDLFGALRDETGAPAKNEVLCGVQINRKVCLMSRRQG